MILKYLSKSYQKFNAVFTKIRAIPREWVSSSRDMALLDKETKIRRLKYAGGGKIKEKTVVLCQTILSVWQNPDYFVGRSVVVVETDPVLPGSLGSIQSIVRSPDYVLRIQAIECCAGGDSNAYRDMHLAGRKRKFMRHEIGPKVFSGAIGSRTVGSR